jgi:outer membrane receptor protein involved in Fe transport
VTSSLDWRKSHRVSSSSLTRGVLWVALLAPVLAPAGNAQSDRIIQFDIPRQRADQALIEFAEQADVTFIFPVDNTRKVTANAVHGEFTQEEAIQRLLEGTGLHPQFQANGELVVNTEKGDAVKKRGLIATIIAALAGGGALNANAQDVDAGVPTRIEEVIVTAQKREERLLDVPISMVVMSPDELQKRRILRLDDLATAVPGLSIQSSGSHQRRIILRGIGNVFGSASLIGLYLDEAALTGANPASQPDVQTYDLERVEVLRGPQGTLYGEGSAGGTIRFLTKNPVLDHFGMNADISALFTDDGSPSEVVRGMVNVPLVENMLGLRIAGTFDHGGGWIDQPAADKEDFNDQELINVRTKLLFQPSDKLSVNGMVVLHRNDSPPNASEDSEGNYTQTFGLTVVPSNLDKYNLYNLTATYDFSGVRLLSTSTYVDQTKELRNRGRTLGLNPPGNPLSLDFQSFDQDIRSFTQEVRLVSTSEARLQWTVGGMYRDWTYNSKVVQQYFSQSPPPNATPTSPGVISIANFPDRDASESWAAFADASYKVTDRLTLGAGLRHFEDRKEKGATPASFRSGKFDALTPRVYAKYQLSETANIYSSAAEGFRTGGFNGATSLLRTYDPEKVWTYELGTKMSLLDRTLDMDFALFYSEYDSYQIRGTVINPNSPNPIVGVTSNAGNAWVKGVEWAIGLRPSDAWRISFNGNYVDSEFDEINATSSSHSVGDGLDLVPKYTVTVGVERNFAWGQRPGYVRLDYNQLGRSTFRNRFVNGAAFGPTPYYFSESDVSNMLNASLNLGWGDRVSVELFAQNLLDDRGYLDPFSIEGAAARARPRTYGIGFGVRFE